MFKDRIKKLRKAENWTQEDVAMQLNIARSSFSRYETGEREPDIDTIKTLSELFHVSSDYLLGITDDPIDYADADLILDATDEQRVHFLELCDNDEKEAAKAYLKFKKAEREDALRENALEYREIEKAIKNPDIRMIARAGGRMTDEQAEIVRKYAQYMFPEAFEEE